MIQTKLFSDLVKFLDTSAQNHSFRIERYQHSLCNNTIS